MHRTSCGQVHAIQFCEKYPGKGAMTESETNSRTVVLGVDDSEHSERAFDWYIKNLCDKQKDHVLIIHAQENPPLPSASIPAPYVDMFYAWQREVETKDKQVKKLLETYGIKCKQHGVQFKLIKDSEKHSNPGEVICQLVKDEKAQLIVTGSRGVGTLRRTFLGSVSDYCVHHAHCPVIVVPPPNRHGDHGHSS